MQSRVLAAAHRYTHAVSLSKKVIIMPAFQGPWEDPRRSILLIS